MALRLSALTDGLAVHMVLGDAEHTPEAYVAMSLAAASLELGCDPAELERAAQDVGCAATMSWRRTTTAGPGSSKAQRSCSPRSSGVAVRTGTP